LFFAGCADARHAKVAPWRVFGVVPASGFKDILNDFGHGFASSFQLFQTIA